MKVGRTIRGEGTPRPWDPSGHHGITGGNRVVAQVLDIRDRDVILRAVNDYETMRALLDRLAYAYRTGVPETIELIWIEVAREWIALTEEVPNA